ncbi:MAG: N-6 DNA methylase [Chitinophagaceae bacterium]
MYTKEEAFAKVSELVEKFSDQISSYKKSEYNETLTRKDFIDPFFEALGWDMNNKAGAWEAYREVIHEDKLKVGGVTTAPDYSFRLVGGQRLFFVEAKKPSILIKDDVAPAYQVRLYGWNAKLAISVVTDFEEFAIYECSKKPLRTDKTSKARVNYFTYKDYLIEFDFFWNTFSKQQVIKGGLIKFQQSDKKGTATVDKDFLEKLDTWRKELATNIFKNNADINEDELNYAVQQTIDRIIFLRIAEDRGLEPYAQLKSCLKNEGQYKELYRQFRIADDKYNSGLFHFKKEKDNPKEPDNISGKLIIENKVIKSIIGSLYPPNSDYLFNVLPVEILGSAYEQFLGKQIIVKGGRATIEDKPEVRKAGGVYYTPQYIVEYIVENTVGKLCEGKTPKDVAILKIVDPACGSGSFLLGAYQYLLTWHIKFYAVNTPTDKHKDAVLTPDGSLTTAEKKRILLNNIYGVDIDRNAVEVTKLSLLLKCMEGETTASITTQMTFFNERVLPSLENNIKSGNSLIDVDFYDTEFDYGEEKKIKAFNWQQGFSEVFKQGGFDVVIGNPPYDVLEKDRLGEVVPHLALQKYITFNNNYSYALGGKLNLYRFFVIKSIQLTRNKGRFGLIVPSSILADKSCSKSREYLLSNTNGLEFDCFPQKDNPSKRIFYDAKLSTTIFFGEKVTSIKEEEQKFIIRTYPANSFNDEHKNCVIELKDLKAIDANNLPIPLIDNINWEILRNIHTKEKIKGLGSLNDFVIRRGEINQTIYREFIEGELSDNERLIKGVQIGKYRFNKKLSQGKIEYFNEKRFLKKNSVRDIADVQRIATQRITGVDERLRIVASVVEPKSYFADSTNSLHVTKDTEYDLKYLLGLLNSRLFQWRFKLTSTNNNVGTNELAALPFRIIDFKNQIEKQLHDEIVKHVNTMLELNKQKQATTNSETLEQLKQRIAYSDDKINKLVYELYELSEEEIGIVEGK